MKRPLVSVIVPVYKVPEQYLRKSIESIQKQTFTELEILLIDDGSPDRCGNICDEYAERDKRINVIHKKNGGLASARNAGFYVATGDWIMFVDGDDWIEADMCEKMLDAGASRENLQLIMCGICKTYGEKYEPYKYYDFEDKQYFDKKGCKQLQVKLLDFNSWIACAYAKLISRQYLKKFNIIHDSELRQGIEGLEFNMRLFENLASAVFVKQWFYHYMYNDESISANVTEETNKYIIVAFEKINKFILVNDNRKELKKALYNRIHYVIITTAISGYFHPKKPGNYKEKILLFERFLDNPLISQALQYKHTVKMDMIRKLAFVLIKVRCYWGVSFMAYLRYYQKKEKQRLNNRERK